MSVRGIRGVAARLGVVLSKVHPVNGDAIRLVESLDPIDRRSAVCGAAPEDASVVQTPPTQSARLRRCYRSAAGIGGQARRTEGRRSGRPSWRRGVYLITSLLAVRIFSSRVRCNCLRRHRDAVNSCLPAASRSKYRELPRGGRRPPTDSDVIAGAARGLISALSPRAATIGLLS